MRRALLVTLSLSPVFFVCLAAGAAFAKPGQPANRAEVRAAAGMRMVSESIDLGDFQAARQSLTQSLDRLRRAGSGARPIAAKVHASLGVVLIQGFKDTKAATEQFSKAITIQKTIALPKYAGARAELVFARAYEVLYPTVACDSLVGVYHTPVVLAQEGAVATVEAKLDSLLAGGSLFIMYRSTSGGDFREVAMSLADGCTFRGDIPAASVRAPKIEYYLEARLQDGRVSARKGDAKLPFVVNVSFGTTTTAEPSPAEVATVGAPEAAGQETGEPDASDVEDLLITTPKNPKGSGCAGCATGNGGRSTGSLLLSLLVLMVLLGARRSSALATAGRAE